jgi:uncharacterized protein (TIGR04255 family)
LDEYFTASIKVPDSLPQDVQSYLLRTVLTFEGVGNAIVTQAPHPIGESKTVSVFLDIDVFRVVDLAPDDDQVWSIFVSLREVKNRIFKAYLTPKAMEMFR